LLGYDQSREPKDYKDLPELSADYFLRDLQPKLKKIGLEIIAVEQINSKVLKNYPSKWAKKLSFANPRDFYHLRLRAD
jgi:hypothetical protein